MSLLYKNRIEIPESLARSIRSICLDRIGLYDSVSHTFVSPSFSPTQGRYEEIQSEMKVHEIDVAEVIGITKLVLQNNRTDASSEIIHNINVLGDKSLSPLTHLRITENRYTTDLLYLGESRFFVVDTTRPTIIPDDVLVTHVLNDNRWEFDIVRNGEKFVDEIFLRQQAEAWFVTGKICQVEKFHYPEINTIIDESLKWGDCFMNVHNFSEAGLWELVGAVKSCLTESSPDYIENNHVFPKYKELVALAKKNGIPSYILNIIAQRIEKNEPHPYNFVQEDWEEHITEAEKEKRRKQEIEARQEARNNLEKSFDEAKKSIKKKNVLFGLFEKDGAVANLEEMEKIIAELERTANDPDIQVKIHSPRMDYANATQNSQRNKKKNAVNGIILGAVVAAAIFLTVTLFLTKRGVRQFDKKVSCVAGMIQDARYEEADSILENAYKSFSPSYMKVRVIITYKRMQKEVEAAIDTDVQGGIEQINTILKATRGRFDKNTEEMLFRLLKLRPENEELLKLKEKWKKS